MNRFLAIGLAVAALSAALSFDAIGGTKHQRVADANGGAGVTPYYVRGPRIIQVPQADDEVVERSNDIVAPPPRHRAIAPKRHIESKRTAPKQAAKKTPRWTLRNDAPPPPPPKPLGPRRAVLSAPPPRAEGLSPIYPTPRFDAKVTAAQKFERPSQTEAAANPPPPLTAPPLSNELPAATDN